MKYLDYYKDDNVQKFCHDVKQDKDLPVRMNAIDEISKYLAYAFKLDSTCVLIPAPQHMGYADYTRMIAESLVIKCGATLADILRCNPRDPLYVQKQSGDDEKIDTGLYLAGDFDLNIDNPRFYFIDNVIATGATYKQARKLVKDTFDKELIPAVYAVDYDRLDDEEIIEILQNI